jgi:hypothetical protein
MPGMDTVAPRSDRATHLVKKRGVLPVTGHNTNPSMDCMFIQSTKNRQGARCDRTQTEALEISVASKSRTITGESFGMRKDLECRYDNTCVLQIHTVIRLLNEE